MSHRLQTNRRQRRLSLLACSSLVFAGAISAAGLALAPTAAFAAVDPCGVDPDTNAAAADDIVCAVADYATGIEHTSNGDLSVAVQYGSSFGTGGVVTTAGNAADNLEVFFTSANTGVFSGTAYPILFDIESQEGDIALTTYAGGIQSNNAATTHAVRAISTAGGTVRLDIGDAIGSTEGTGAEVRSFGGGDVIINAGTIFGGDVGILALVEGAGTITINASADTTNSSSLAAMQVTGGTGLVSITGGAHGGATSSGPEDAGDYGVFVTSGGAVQYSGRAIGAISGVRIDTDGDITINGQGSGGQYGIDLITAAGSEVTLNLTPRSGGVGSQITEGGIAAIRATGGGDVTVNVTGGLQGGLDFGGLTNPAAVNVQDGGYWLLTHTTSVSGGVDIEVAEGGRIFTGEFASSPTVTFGGDDDSLAVEGEIAIGSIRSASQGTKELASTTTFMDLEEFRLSGTVFLGARFPNEGDLGTLVNDNVANDILSMPGAHFIGEEGSIVMDVNLNAAGQSACDTALRGSNGQMPGGDCVDLAGGTTEGVTYLNIQEAFPFDRGSYSPDGIVLVDVDGGTSGAGHFLLDPASDNYTDGVINKGFFAYALVYNADTEQHVLTGAPGGDALIYPLLTQAAHALWRTSTGTWLDRQADLRGEQADGYGAGSWLRVSTESAEREVEQSVLAGGNTLTYGNDFGQDSYAISGGVDLIVGNGADSAYVVGIMAGYAHSEVDFEVSGNSGTFDGWTAGAYASYVAGPLFVDAAINTTVLNMDVDVPSLDLFPSTATLDTNLLSVGGQVEAGLRFQFGSLFAEPLASLSYVSTRYDDLRIAPDDPARQGIDLAFDDPASLRAGLGGRLGLDQDFGGLRSQFAGTVRVWEELDGESNITARNSGPDARLTDEFAGTFTDVAFSAALYSPGGAVSSLLNVGGKFGDDYSATTASVALRVHW